MLIDTVDHTISCTTTHFTQFAVNYRWRHAPRAHYHRHGQSCFHRFQCHPAVQFIDAGADFSGGSLMLTNPGQPLSGLI